MHANQTTNSSTDGTHTEKQTQTKKTKNKKIKKPQVYAIQTTGACTDNKKSSKAQT